VGASEALIAESARPHVELADIFRVHGDCLRGLTADQAKAVRAIMNCRTAVLGGHVEECDRCGYQLISYNSCRNRHCPKCQSLEKARWIEARQADILPVEYHHVVFTIAPELHPFFQGNSKAAIKLLFESVSETLQEVALNPKRLGARIGFTAVLHTWTQTLLYHPHIHCIVPGGGISSEGDRWIACSPGFFLPVRVLSVVFRGKLLSKLESAMTQGALLSASDGGATLLRKAAGKDWVVYSKPPVAGPEQVLDYLGRYTHRTAISNHRLVSLENGRVTFQWKDRAHADRKRLMTLDAPEFLRRFLLHVLPSGLVRIRHYGFLANGVRRREIARCRALLGATKDTGDEAISDTTQETWQQTLLRLTGKDLTRCPICKEGRLVDRGRFPRRGRLPAVLGRGTSP
jgi:predicted Zn-ribbon and HTH transcriptional regulator